MQCACLERYKRCQISDGYFGNTRLDAVRFARLHWFPGAVHEGNGVRRTIVDEQATKEQREALIALDSGQHGGPYWEIFAALCPNLIEPLFAPITLEVDREKRRATIRIPGTAESEVEPIKNPATGEEHRPASCCPMASNSRRRRWVTRCIVASGPATS